MAYKQTPGRGNGTKTGAGISPTLMSKSPMYQNKKETKIMSERDLAIEKGAKNDSIEAANKAGDFFTKRQKAVIGNKAANKTRAINNSTVTVKKTEVIGKKGPEDKYTKTPAKQMSKLKSGKSPAKQMSKMSDKKAPMKMKKC